MKIGFSRFCTVAFVSGIFLLPAAQAEPVLSQADGVRVEKMRDAILNDQLADGAIPVIGYKSAGQPVYIEPYLAHLACLGVLSAHAYKPDSRDLPYVYKWLMWYGANMEVDGTMKRRDGTRSAQGTLAPGFTKLDQDSDDSYAALYLAVAAEYRKATGAAPNGRIIAACRKCVSVLEHCYDSSNKFYLTFVGTSGKTPAHYLLDNTEVHFGLVEGDNFFTAVKIPATATECRNRASDLAANLGNFWYPEQAYYVPLYNDKAAKIAWNTGPFYDANGVATQAEAQALATVSALAFWNNAPLGRHSKLYARLTSNHKNHLAVGFAASDYNKEDPTIERFYFAVLKAGPTTDRSVVLDKVRSRVDEFIARNAQLASNPGLQQPYVHRFGMLIQALLSQNGQFPDQLPSVPLSQASTNNF